MRATIKGFQTVDYQKKGSDERVKGVTLALTYKSSEYYGEAVKEEFISIRSPFYEKVEKYLSSDVDKLIGAGIFIDLVNVKRGSYTYSEITDLEITPAAAKQTEKKAV